MQDSQNWDTVSAQMKPGEDVAQAEEEDNKKLKHFQRSMNVKFIYLYTAVIDIKSMFALLFKSWFLVQNIFQVGPNFIIVTKSLFSF